MVSTRSNPQSARATRLPTSSQTQSRKKTNSKATTSKKKRKTTRQRSISPSSSSFEERIENSLREDEPITTLGQTNQDLNEQSSGKEANSFRSRYPGLEIEDFEEHLDEWTVVSLRQAIAKQDSKTSRASSAIDTLVKGIRLEYEKRMLMAALMGGVPEAVIWNIVGEGARKGHANPWIRFLAFCPLALAEPVPEPGDSDGWTIRNKAVSRTWKTLSEDQKDVFRDPFFFALAGLPDLSSVPLDDNELNDMDEENETNLDHLDESTAAPLVHKLTDEEKQKYQPLFDELVDSAKLHLCHGKPAPTTSVATVQKKSLLQLRKAHHAFAVVCQQYQITYYLAAVSCGSTEGWTQVFSNNIPFAKWASTDTKVPQIMASYIHGQSAAKTVEGIKPQQPSDERKTRLGKELNHLVDTLCRGHKFPKCQLPEEEINNIGLPIRIVQKAGSLLSKEELDDGHRLAKSSTVKSWLHDIKNGLFVIELIPESERVESGLGSKQQSRKSKKKKTSNSSSAINPANRSAQLPNANTANEGNSRDHQITRQPNPEAQITQQSNSEPQTTQQSSINSTQLQPSSSGVQPSVTKSSKRSQGKSQGNLKRKLAALAKGDNQRDQGAKKAKHVAKTKKMHLEETSDDSDTPDDTPEGSDTPDDTPESDGSDSN